MLQILGVLCFWILAGICRLLDIVINGVTQQYQQESEPEAVSYQPLPDWRPSWSPEDIQAAEDDVIGQIDDEYDDAVARMKELAGWEYTRRALEAGGSYADF